MRRLVYHRGDRGAFQHGGFLPAGPSRQQAVNAAARGGYLLAHKPEVLEELAAQIASGTFRVKDYREREIIEGGKLRRIQVNPDEGPHRRA